VGGYEPLAGGRSGGLRRGRFHTGDFEKADVILSLDNDFLGTDGDVADSRAFSARRKGDRTGLEDEPALRGRESLHRHGVASPIIGSGCRPTRSGRSRRRSRRKSAMRVRGARDGGEAFCRPRCGPIG
jgi:hypothetical protein